MKRILFLFLSLLGFLITTVKPTSSDPPKSNPILMATTISTQSSDLQARLGTKPSEDIPSDMTRAEYNLVLQPPYGLHYTESKNEWSLYGVMTAVGEVDVWGSTGIVSLIAYTLDGHQIRYGWSVVEVDGYKFRTYQDVPMPGVKVRLHIDGPFVSIRGIDLEKCYSVDDKDFCELLSFVEGGFLKSPDYAGLTISPSNELINSGYLPDNWWNGMLCWPMSPVEEPEGQSRNQ